RVVGRDIRASLAGELKGIGAGQVEEPEIHRVLGGAENEVRLAGACGHHRRNLDRNRVGELRWRRGCRGRFGKRVLRGASCRRLPGGGWRDCRVAKWVTGVWSTAPRCGGGLLFLFHWHRKRWSVLSRFL